MAALRYVSANLRETDRKEDMNDNGSLNVRCLACGKSIVLLKKRVVWPWQKMRGMRARLVGTCPACHVEATVIGWNK